MSTVLHRVAAAAATVVVVTTLSLAGAGTAVAAPSTQDTDYITTNGQTSLAEIAIGQLALQRAQNAATRELAQMTLTDHQAALAKLQAVAGQLGVPVPTEPSPDQQKDAATLQGVDAAAFDLTYAQIQVAGHQKSIAGTNKEISTGSDPAITGYATGYLPVAAMHLQMAQQLLTDLGGTPTAVPAGTGGLAATTPAATMLWQALALIVGAGLLTTGTVLGLRRRRSLR